MKSQVKETLLELALAIYSDSWSKCAASQPDSRDIDTIISRVEDEGLSFLTITLPDFGKSFDRSLAEACVDSTQFRSFRKSGSIPAFLQGMVSHVFDQATGRLLNEDCLPYIESVRNFTYAFKKIKLSCSEARERAARQEFFAVERDLTDVHQPDNDEIFDLVSHVIWNDVLPGSVDPYVDFIPKHGPGATCEKITGNRKYLHEQWYERLEGYFPLDIMKFANANSVTTEAFKKVTLVSSDKELPVRVISVPKTLKGPRLIAIEPVCMQYTQQAVSRYLVDILETARLTRGHVNFTDQSVNQRLALSSSKDGKFATLDLSSASDRVPLSMVERMLRCRPDLLDCIKACRSKSANVDGEIIHLNKFASMGSALCFPIESMYFYTLCVAALVEKHRVPVTRRNVDRISRRVYVYGDDIIVPTNDAADVATYLQKYYCKVGAHKSFWTGLFRESCGMDAYAGHSVTPTYVRNVPPCDKRDTEILVSWIKSSNAFYLKGYWKTSTLMINKCEKILGSLPLVGPESPGLGKLSFQGFRSVERWNRHLHRFEVKAMVAKPVYRKDMLDGNEALLKSLLLLRSGSTEEIDSKHLERSVRRGAVTLKSRWIAVE